MYGSLLNSNTYHTARGNTIWVDADDTVKEGALQRASDYIDFTYRSRFPGNKTGGRAQAQEWPRANVSIDDEALPDDEVPIEVEQATYEAALLLVSGISLNPVSSGGVVKRERVKVGPVESETEYQDSSSDTSSSFAVIDGMMEPVLTAASAAEYQLLRA